MPSDDYASVSRGGLKLKGVAGSKVEKKKKKKKPKDDVSAREGPAQEAEKDTDRALSKVLADEDGKIKNVDGVDQGDGEEVPGEAREGERELGSGKTEAERRHEERRRKMVSESILRDDRWPATGLGLRMLTVRSSSTRG
jgi:protein FAM32A